MRLIESHHLKSWADSVASRSRLPYLVEQLIRSRVTRPQELRFPSGDDVGLPGFDGMLVVSREQSEFIPNGASIWEMGTGNPKKKADEDYEKRTSQARDRLEKRGPSGTDDFARSGALTFVFVTPRVWTDKRTWAEARKTEGMWRDVRVIDGVDLVEWIESAPAMNLQFAAELGLVPESGVQSLEGAWEEWRRLTEPPISPELVLLGRLDQQKEVLSRLLQSPTTVVIRADSPREAYGFSLAAILGAPDKDTLNTLKARTVIAANEEIANRLARPAGLVVLLKEVRSQVSEMLPSQGSHVLIPEGNDVRSTRGVVELPRPTFRSFSEALFRMGVSQEEAERISRACGRSVTILQRRIRHRNFDPPTWANPADVRALLPFVLAVRWDESNSDDRNILCRLADAAGYEEIESQVLALSNMDDPPLQKLGNVVALTAPVDAFELVARSLTPSLLARFKVCFADVFGRIDPGVEIKSEEWISYQLNPPTGPSSWLRTGLVEMLLLIADRGQEAKLRLSTSIQQYVDGVIRDIPNLNSDWHMLASLRDVFPRLMEAAPDPLLDSLERLLEVASDKLKNFFIEGDFFGPGPMHTGLLWGLEILAWNPKYLARASLILAQLAAIDPGGTWSNRPINSLVEIFLPRNPGTYAKVEDRLQALESIVSRHPDVAWTLVSKLLPESTTVSHPTAEPRWRDRGEPPSGFRTFGEMWKVSGWAMEQATNLAGTIPERWGEILRSFKFVSSEVRNRVSTRLNESSDILTSDEEKIALLKILRKFVNQQRSFSDAAWALKDNELHGLDAIILKLSPSDPIDRHRWLFDDYYPNLPVPYRDVRHTEREISKLRHAAILEIYEKDGIRGLTKLGIAAKSPISVASAAVEMLATMQSVQDLLIETLSETNPASQYAMHVSSFARARFSQEWVEWIRDQATRDSWNAATIACVVIGWPDSRETWNEAARFGPDVESAYWKQLPPLAQLDHSPEDQVFKISKWISVGRAVESLQLIAYRSKTTPTQALIDLLDAAFKELNQTDGSQGERITVPDAHDLQQLFELLRQRQDIERKEIARREYQWLPLLGYFDSARLTIHEFMAQDPAFFVGLVCDVFLPEDRADHDKEEATAQQKARALAGYRLLQTFKVIPGASADNDIDKEVLLSWLAEVRAMSKELRRAEVADARIGELLAHAPPDPADGAWPHRSVRNAIEVASSDAMERGIAIGRFNLRGVVTKAVFEGGEKERDLASQYRSWAAVSRTPWPRTASLLERIARDYEAHGKAEDDRSKQDEIRFS